MSIQYPFGTLDIKNATLRVGKLAHVTNSIRLFSSYSRNGDPHRGISIGAPPGV